MGVYRGVVFRLRGGRLFLPVFGSIFGWFFDTWFLADGFLFMVKELGFLTNRDHWIRVLDVNGSYMYIVL
jgi:hypothetical protein